MSEESQKKIFEAAKKRYEEIMLKREEILKAFIAKYGCQPEQLMWVEANAGKQVFAMLRQEAAPKLQQCPTCGLTMRSL